MSQASNDQLRWRIPLGHYVELHNVLCQPLVPYWDLSIWKVREFVLYSSKKELENSLLPQRSSGLFPCNLKVRAFDDHGIRTKKFNNVLDAEMVSLFGFEFNGLHISKIMYALEPVWWPNGQQFSYAFLNLQPFIFIRDFVAIIKRASHIRKLWG